MTAIIETRGLTKRFGAGGWLGSWFGAARPQAPAVVDGVDLDVSEGEIFGLLGPNGAGKTTLIKMLCTLLLPSSGRASVCGYDVVEQAKRVRETIGLVASDERSFYWRLTGRQNLRFFAALHHLFGREAETRIDGLFDALGLADAADRRFAEYSTGMRQRLAIARGLLKRPRVLLMDEPTKGVDPLNGQALLALIRERISKEFGQTVLITTHILSDAEQVCDRVAILNKGHIMACGTIAEIRRSANTAQRYVLHIDGYANGSIAALGRVPGVERCLSRDLADGIVLVEIDIAQDSQALPLILDRIIHGKGRVLRCSSSDRSFEEVFRHLLQRSEKG